MLFGMTIVGILLSNEVVVEQPVKASFSCSGINQPVWIGEEGPFAPMPPCPRLAGGLGSTAAAGREWGSGER